jgi:hypothetical protein
MSFDTIDSMTTAQKKKLLKAKIAVAYYHETGKVPTEKIIEDLSLYIRISYKAILGLHYKRQEQKKNGQLPMF